MPKNTHISDHPLFQQHWEVVADLSSPPFTPPGPALPGSESILGRAQEPSLPSLPPTTRWETH